MQERKRKGREREQGMEVGRERGGERKRPERQERFGRECFLSYVAVLCYFSSYYSLVGNTCVSST